MKKGLILSTILSAALFASEPGISAILEETTELATKTRVNADYVPGSVTIIRGDELEALGILNLAQPNALDMIVGMESATNSLRGSGSVYGGNGVKIKWLINGKTVSSQLWSGSVWGKSTINFGISTAQIDRVEVLRGPDSAIYGDNAIFGVINIITKKGEDSLFFGGGYNGDGKFQKGASANYSYQKDALKLSLSASAFDSAGYELNIEKEGNFYNWLNAKQYPAATGGELPNGYDTASLFVDGEYEGFKAWGSVVQKRYAQGAYGSWLPTDPLPVSDKKRGVDRYLSAGVSKSFEIREGFVKLEAGVDRVDNSLDNFLRITGDFGDSGFDAIRTLRYREERSHADITVSKKLGSHSLIGGVFASSTKNSTDDMYNNYTIDWSERKTIQKELSRAHPVTVEEGTKREQRAIFAQDSWGLNDKTTVTFGARYDRFDGDIDMYGFSPRVAIAYMANESNILKAQYARAFRPPTFSEMGAMYFDVYAETIDTFELSHIYKKSGVSLKTTVFESRIRDMITFNDITYDTENIRGTAKIRGVEIEAKYDGDSFEVGLNQAFYNTKTVDRVYIPQYATSESYLFPAQSFALAPRYIGNLFLKLNKESSHPTTFWYHFVGPKKRKSSFETTVQHYQYLKSLNGESEAQGYLNITQQFLGVREGLDISMGVQNLFGKEIKTLYMPLNQPNNKDIPYMGRSFWLNLSYKF